MKHEKIKRIKEIKDFEKITLQHYLYQHGLDYISGAKEMLDYLIENNYLRNGLTVHNNLIDLYEIIEDAEDDSFSDMMNRPEIAAQADALGMESLTEEQQRLLNRR